MKWGGGGWASCQDDVGVLLWGIPISSVGGAGPAVISDHNVLSECVFSWVCQGVLVCESVCR
jgi:hypothetical protein